MVWRNPTVFISALRLAQMGVLSCLLGSAWAASPPESAALTKRSIGAGDALFEKLPASETGVNLVNPIDISHPLKRLYVGGYASGGLALGDIDGDGRLDLFAASGPRANALYLQVGTEGDGLRFEDVTAKVPGLEGGEQWAAGAAFADIDGDEDLDLYICHHDAPNQLFINETQKVGEPIFTEGAAGVGLALSDASFMPSFCDYDNDGDLDLFILGYQFKDPKGRPRWFVDPESGELRAADKDGPLVTKSPNGDYVIRPDAEKYYGIVPSVTGRPTFRNVGRADRLLRNDGGEFKDVTAAAGIAGQGVGNSALWFDSDEDGDLDLYVANDFKWPDQFYRNNGDGTFTDTIKDAVPHTTWFSMGSDVGDLNDDGRLDLVISDMAGTTHYRSKVTMGEMQKNADFLRLADPQQYMRNTVYLNTGTPRFLEAAYLTKLAHSDWTWAVKLGDYDNDGRTDVFFTNGSARMFNHSDHSHKQDEWFGKTEWDLWEGLAERHEENLAFRNLGDLRFENVSQQWGLGDPSMSYACAHGDLDNDGDLDLVIADLNGPVAIYRNQSEGRAIRLRLRGKRGNTHALGARVVVKAGDRVRAFQLMPSTGFLSNNDPWVHVGLGDRERVDEITVHWPGGGSQSLGPLAAGRHYVIEEDLEVQLARPEAPNPQFSKSGVIPAVRHVETPFDDFARQPLLPNKLSQLGPGMAVGDVDGDGDDDFYMGRGKGGRRAIYTNAGGGKLTVAGLGPFAGEEHYEDQGVLFFDADRDGDQDLYVVSGGVEGEPGDAVFQDRLYVNQGNARFVRWPEALPKFTDSGSVVTAGDVDRDGDLDLFVGGRVVPGSYPEVPTSHLLENRSTPGKPAFVISTERWAPTLARTGMVTSALWSDANGDGWLDLLVTHDWGPVKCFLNEGGKRLVDRTEEAGLAAHLGWWNGIASGDFDGDGDLDYAVTNFGLNTKYKASPKKPELLYYGDFDGTGKRHLVEAKFEKDLCVPRRGLSCSSHAMPFVRQKMGSFHKFGLASLQELYTAPKLEDALRLKATHLESGCWINEGTDKDSKVPKFRFQPWARVAQVSPGFGVVATDFDGDGFTDIFASQNFFGPQVETGRTAGGLGQWLRGKADGEPVAIGARSSGISVPGDAKSAVVVDFNEDLRPDLLVGVNNEVMEAYDNRAQVLSKNRFLKVQLIGPAGNPTCVGARVRLRFHDEKAHPACMAEVSAGGGYLSQSTAALFFGSGTEAKPKALEVYWPNGTANRYPLEQAAGLVRITMPQ